MKQEGKIKQLIIYAMIHIMHEVAAYIKLFIE